MFLWRSITQWVGDMGVIALFVAVLPRLAIGGRELFFAEASGLSEEELDASIEGRQHSSSGSCTPRSPQHRRWRSGWPV